MLTFAHCSFGWRITAMSHCTHASAWRAARLLAALTLATAVGCAPDADDAASDGDDGISQAQSAVLNGTDLSWVDDFSGVVRLWAYARGEFRQFCGGVLLRNNRVLTAKHCIQQDAADLAGGWPNFEADLSQVFVSTNHNGYFAAGDGLVSHAPDDRDISSFRISGNLPVRVNGTVMWNNYFRKLAPSLANGNWTAVLGYGPTSQAGYATNVCTYFSSSMNQRIKGCWSDQFQLNHGIGTALIDGVNFASIGVEGLQGDSGGPTVLYGLGGDSLADLELVGINSARYLCINGSCGAKAARTDDIRWWLEGL
jgi:hypothetical protein